MTNYGFTNQKLSLFESSSPVDLSRKSLSIMESHLHLEKEEQKEFEEAILKWGEKNAALKPQHYVYARLMFAYCRFYAEAYEDALAILSEVEPLLKVHEDWNSLAACNVIRGNIYRTNGNFDVSLHAFMAAEERLAEEPQLLHFHLATLVNIGGIYLDTKHYDESLAPFRKVLELAEPSKRYYWLVYALIGLGKSYTALKNFKEAQECFQKALDTAVRSGQSVSISSSLGEMGNYLFITGNLEEAEKLHKKALAIREQNNYPGGAITSCLRLGEIYLRQARYDDAEAILHKGLDVANRLKVNLRTYPVHFLLSELYEHKKDLAKSLSHYKQYSKLREQVEREDSDRNIKNARVVFQAEQTKKENAVIKRQKEEIERKNIELQETIDKLTRARIGKKARAITLVIAIGLFMIEDLILHYALSLADTENYFISITIKIVIIFSLSPINKAVERYLVQKMLREERRVLV